MSQFSEKPKYEIGDKIHWVYQNNYADIRMSRIESVSHSTLSFVYRDNGERVLTHAQHWYTLDTSGNTDNYIEEMSIIGYAPLL